MFIITNYKINEKATVRYHLTLVRQAIINKSANNKIWREYGGRESPNTSGGNVNWYNHCGEQYGDSFNLK